MISRLDVRIAPARSLLGLTAALLLLVGGAGCRGCEDTPVIEVRFDPQDLARPAEGHASVADAAVAARPPAGEGASLDGACAQSADCVIANADCCGCAAGGKATALSQAQAKAQAARLAKSCENTVCAEMMSLDPSCKKVASCVDRRCVLVDEKK